MMPPAATSPSLKMIMSPLALSTTAPITAPVPPYTFPASLKQSQPVPLYFLGARIDGLYPLGPIFHGAGLNITVMSTAGRMHVGLIACRDAVPDIDLLGQDFETELDALYAATVG